MKNETGKQSSYAPTNATASIKADPAPTTEGMGTWPKDYFKAEPAVERPTEPPYETEYELTRRIRELESELSSLRRQVETWEEGHALVVAERNKVMLSDANARAQVEELKAALRQIDGMTTGSLPLTHKIKEIIREVLGTEEGNRG